MGRIDYNIWYSIKIYSSKVWEGWLATLQVAHSIMIFSLLYGKSFKAKIMMESWLKELKKEGKIGISDKGWTNNYLGLEWYKQVFNPFTKKCQKGQYQLIILDGHCSHITSDLIEFCKREKIISACLPPHTTYLLQLLDVTFSFLWQILIREHFAKNSD